MTDRVDALLANAVSAARQRAQLGVDDGAATRLRLRESLTSGGARRRRRLTIIAAVIASLFGSTAYALVTGWRPPMFTPTTVEAVAPAIEPPVIERPHAERRVTIVRPTPPPPAIEEAIVAPAKPKKPAAKPSVVEPSKPAVASNPAVEPSKPSVVEPTSGEPNPAVAPSPSQRSAELAAYRVAHHAHFRGTDPVAALAAWDAYLAKFPNGELAPEARYDRALVLIKLKRMNDARMALIPFATAPAGSYRQREAAKLLEALR